jgi:predicted  nucleic acid-binding Zn-ribbon protein
MQEIFSKGTYEGDLLGINEGREMSDTPRTDACEGSASDHLDCMALTEHARQLERELVAARAEIARLIKRRDEYSNGWAGALATVQRFECKLAEAREELNDKRKFCYDVEQALDGMKGNYVEIILALRKDAEKYRYCFNAAVDAAMKEGGK